MSNNLKSLISKLNDNCRRAAERAASICMAKGHYEVDIEHLILALLEQPRCDLTLLCLRHDVLTTALVRDLEAELGQFKGGNTRTPVFSAHLPTLLEHAWLIASLDSHNSRIRSGHLLLALLTAPDLSQLAYRGSKLFVKFQVDALKHKLNDLTAGSEEDAQNLRGTDATAIDDDNANVGAPLLAGKTPALDQFTTNLTQRARDGKLAPGVGRARRRLPAPPGRPLATTARAPG